ncbi:MAG: hypothetical protein GXY83_24045 [Rhodopirellula sp.]|nr:hypothetical protein [Rhodopirellula sp.]
MKQLGLAKPPASLQDLQGVLQQRLKDAQAQLLLSARAVDKDHVIAEMQAVKKAFDTLMPLVPVNPQPSPLPPVSPTVTPHRQGPGPQQIQPTVPSSQTSASSATPGTRHVPHAPVPGAGAARGTAVPARVHRPTPPVPAPGIPTPRCVPYPAGTPRSSRSFISVVIVLAIAVLLGMAGFHQSRARGSGSSELIVYAYPIGQSPSAPRTSKHSPNEQVPCEEGGFSSSSSAPQAYVRVLSWPAAVVSCDSTCLGESPSPKWHAVPAGMHVVEFLTPVELSVVSFAHDFQPGCRYVIKADLEAKTHSVEEVLQ